MSLTIETRDKQKPVILLYGNNTLIPTLFNEYSTDFKIAYIGDIESDKKEDFYRISKTNAKFIKDIEERIEYAVIFLSGKEDKTLIPNFIEKVNSDKTRLAVIIDINNLDDFYDILLEYKNVDFIKFLFLGDVYSEIPSINPESHVAKILKEVIKKKSVSFTDNDTIYPIYYKDAIEGINQILFGSGKFGEVSPKTRQYFYLFYSRPQTIKSLAYLLRKNDPDLEILYKQSKDEEDLIKTHGETYQEIKSKIVSDPLFLDKYFLGFEKSFVLFQSRDTHFEFPAEKIEVQHKKDRTHTAPKGTRLKHIFASTIIAVLLFLVTNGLMIGLGIFLMKSSVTKIARGDYANASQEIKSASTLLSLSEPTAKLGTSVSGINMNRIEESISLMEIASENLNSIENINKGIDRKTLEKTISDGIYFYFRFQQLKDELKNEALDKIDTSSLSKMISLSQELPYLLGYEEEKNYLLLFQNNGELRPTGGFIGSLGELKLKGGKAEIEIRDVYEYDGKLKAHVEPHFIIRRYLQPHLFIRDSNFDPDFQKSASMSALLYNLAAEKKVDGVIAVNFEAVKRLIEEVGPINLPSYKVTLDGKNAFSFLQSTIDDKFFPGSSQKKDVLNSLFNQLLIKLESKNSLIAVSKLFPELMQEKDILFSFSNTSLQGIFTALGYAGVIDLNGNRGKNDISDFLAINEANIGVNKANINIQRTTDYEISFEKSVKSKITHTLTNSGEKDYKVYLRLTIPLGSKLTSINFNQDKQKIIPAITDFKTYENPRFKKLPGLEVDNEKGQRLETYGFIVDVTPKSTMGVEINYDNALLVPKEAIVNYSLSVIKQPGTGEYPFSISLSYGEKFAPKEVENATLEEGKIKISSNLNTDRKFKAQLIKK